MSSSVDSSSSHRRSKRRRSDAVPYSDDELARLVVGPLYNPDISSSSAGLTAALFIAHRFHTFDLQSLHPHDLRRVAIARMFSVHVDLTEQGIEQSLSSESDIPLPHDIPAQTQVALAWRSPREFFRLTRLKPSEFYHLYTKLFRHIIASRKSLLLDRKPSQLHVNQKVHPADQLLVWLLASDGNDSSLIAITFGHINRRTIDRYADHITEAVNQVFADEVYWPDADERIQSYGQFACCRTAVALLDGTHCRIRVPFHEEAAYYSGYKKYHTQNYFIAVDAFGFILYTSDAFKGRSNDRGAFNSTPFAQNNCPLLSDGEFIIVDGGFPGEGQLLQPHTLPQLRAADEATRREMVTYNEELTLDRSLVEHRIHTLKERAQALTQRYARSRENQQKLFHAAARIVNRVLNLRFAERSGIDSSSF